MGISAANGTLNHSQEQQTKMSSIEERVKKIVAEQLGVKEEDIQNSASFVEDLGADAQAAEVGERQVGARNVRAATDRLFDPLSDPV